MFNSFINTWFKPLHNWYHTAVRHKNATSVKRNNCDRSVANGMWSGENVGQRKGKKWVTRPRINPGEGGQAVAAWGEISIHAGTAVSSPHRGKKKTHTLTVLSMHHALIWACVLRVAKTSTDWLERCSSRGDSAREARRALSMEAHLAGRSAWSASTSQRQLPQAGVTVRILWRHANNAIARRIDDWTASDQSPAVNT